jgi:oligoendopeptidase F
MSLLSLPKRYQDFLVLSWEDIHTFFKALEDVSLTHEVLPAWLKAWSDLSALLSESENRLYVAMTQNTADSEAESRYIAFVENITTPSKSAHQVLMRQLLASGLSVTGFEIPLQKMRVDVEIFREENQPLLLEEKKLENEYYKITGAQTVLWEGEELTLPQLHLHLKSVDRTIREKAWRAEMERRLQDREALNTLWGQFLALRRRLAENAGESDYRAYRWKDLRRFDYSPQDCLTFHQAIEQVVVPAAERIYEKRRARLGVERLRPWDLEVDVAGRPPLKPFDDTSGLIHTAETMFKQVDPQLGVYMETMHREGLLDLDSRKNKAPGGYCMDFALSKRPFIFMNAVGTHDDVQTLLHEAGHAFHAFEASALPYLHQQDVPIEFCEVASMAMELLAAPYLAQDQGGYYSRQDAARARIEHLEGILLFWGYMAVVDAFQHWAYTQPQAAQNAADCDAQWSALWDRFMRGVDWSGLEIEKATGWHRKLHIFVVPFYYVEYGLAQLGAAQVWAEALKNPSAALTGYQRALALGGTVSLPELYATAGARFAFDADTLGRMVSLIEENIAQFEGEAA